MNSKLQKLLRTLKVVPKLGYWNVGYVFYYRISLRSGIRKKRFEVSKIKKGDLFSKMETSHPYIDLLENYRDEVLSKANAIMKGCFTFYHYHKFQVGEKPDWFFDPFSNKSLNLDVRQKHWTDINEFDLNTGDIKNLWELSRFDWVIDLARAYAISDDIKYLNRLNELLSDWIIQNPVNIGVNWRCGQETSIRVIKMFWASMIMNKLDSISDVLFDFIIKHLERIEGNIKYAIAQDNNHGTSEATALYIGSAWVLENSDSAKGDLRKKIKIFRDYGRQVLEERIDKLIGVDGTFAQKSINYHRVVVDTMSFVMTGIKKLHEPPFSIKIYNKLYGLALWQLEMIKNKNGEVPNLGANDGAMFMNLHSLGYRDFRASTQLFYALLKEERIWNDKNVDEPLIWTGVLPNHLNEKNNVSSRTIIKDNEFVQLSKGDISINILATQDNFRPGQDVMSLDIWYKGENIIIDSGSYSYNSEDSNYFKSIEAHNCLQFGSMEPMPNISRFLTGEWIAVNNSIVEDEIDTVRWTGSYKDYRNNYHRRDIYIQSKERIIVIEDEYKSNDKEVTLRFHVPDNKKEMFSISLVDINGKLITPHLKHSFHSLYYMHKEKHLVYEFKSDKSTNKFRTEIRLKDKIK